MTVRLADSAFAWNFDVDVLRRHDRPGPRYTSYPTAPQFGDAFGASALCDAIARSQVNTPQRPISLYVHVPFCQSPCFYCGCNRVITRDATRGSAYVRRVLREAGLIAEQLHPARDVVQLHLGGGTPNFLSLELLAELLDGLRKLFRFSAASTRDISIEIDPRTLAVAEIPALAALGFNRVSLGIQDFDPVVQSAIHRIQSPAATVDMIIACRQAGIDSVNADLIYGLPRQTRPGFARTLETVIAAQPSRIAVYSYAHLPHLFKAQRHIAAQTLPPADQKLRLLEQAARMLAMHGYCYIGMDHFALPGDALAIALQRGDLQRNFMGYTTHGDTDLIGLGVSAISHVGDSYSQNPRDLTAWEAAVDQCRLPVCRGLRLSEDDLLRAEAIQALMCHGELDLLALGQRHGIEAVSYFADALRRLQPLVDDGLVEPRPASLHITSRGRPLARLVAMCFDAYLPACS
ncbi:oxygen-independent coproporphyrinogen III oxidase [Xanthomonas maliensis]|uniref:oxygen-independent coproporphyrinogen III oxidase n=1 Tax=Xanthomonas maliensis TaxID=1321368 RepID=UPI0003AABF69|nr:oxygen-independent coproporphyrinogen III oxidase [Xanthomonas maliensis]KAB7763055.1 oxygen-independent coproporphyrinogen III oxidase [Xanthomonas maliensis]